MTTMATPDLPDIASLSISSSDKDLLAQYLNTYRLFRDAGTLNDPFAFVKPCTLLLKEPDVTPAMHVNCRWMLSYASDHPLAELESAVAVVRAIEDRIAQGIKNVETWKRWTAGARRMLSETKWAFEMTGLAVERGGCNKRGASGDDDVDVGSWTMELAERLVVVHESDGTFGMKVRRKVPGVEVERKVGSGSGSSQCRSATAGAPVG